MNFAELTIEATLKRIFAREENAAIRKEYEDVQEEERAIMAALQRAFCESDVHACVGAASYVSRNLPSLVARRFAVNQHILRLLQHEPPAPIAISQAFKDANPDQITKMLIDDIKKAGGPAGSS